MGLAFSNLFNRIWGKHDMTMAVVGLPNAGKSTMIRKLDIGQVETSTPISGLELETLKYKNVTFKVWDISNSEEIRNHYKQYLNSAGAILFVVDSNDHSRMSEAREELHRLANDYDLSDKPFLIFANKQDCNDALNTREVTEALFLTHLGKREWFIQGSCATTGDGLFEGLEWAANTLRKKLLVE